MGIEEKQYKISYGGYIPATDGEFLEGEEVGLIVKVSGHIPGGPQKPEEHEYGKYSCGWQPHHVNWPIMHANCWKGLTDLLGVIRECLEKDMVVYFFCNRGESRAPAAVAVVLGWATGIHPVHWLPTVIEGRHVANWFYTFYVQFHMQDNVQWMPVEYPNWVLMCKFFNQDSSYRRWKTLQGQTSSVPGTPTTTEQRYQNVARNAEYSTTPPVVEEPVPRTYGEVCNSEVWVGAFDKLFDPQPVVQPDPAPGYVPPLAPKARMPRPSWDQSPRQRGRSPAPRNYGAQRGRSPSPRSPRGDQGGLSTPKSRLLWELSPPRTHQDGSNQFPPPPPQWEQGGTPPMMDQPIPRARVPSPPPGQPPSSANHGQWVSPPEIPVRRLPTDVTQPRSPRDPSPHAVYKVGGISGLPAHFGQEGTPRKPMDVMVLKPDNELVNRAFPGVFPEKTTTIDSGLTASNLKTRLPTKASDEHAAGSVDEDVVFNQSAGLTPSLSGDSSVVMGGPAKKKQPAGRWRDNRLTTQDRQYCPPLLGVKESTNLLDLDDFDDGSSLPCPHFDPEDRWVDNPPILYVVREWDLSENMKQFLRTRHRNWQDDFRPYGYNYKGYHVLHTAILEIAKKNFGDWHWDRHTWSQQEFEEFVDVFWDEAIGLTNQQYGSCVPRTHCERPCNNTPLMLLAKNGHPTVSAELHVRMIEKLFFRGKGELGAVDNRDMNALMHAAGSGNKTFFRWAADMAKSLKADGFNFDQRNINTRNAFGMVYQTGADEDIRRMCQDLVVRGFMSPVTPEEAAVMATTAHRRNRSHSKSKSTKPVYHPRVANPWCEEKDWQQQPWESWSSWANRPSSSWANRASSSSSWVGNPEVNAAPLLDGASG